MHHYPGAVCNPTSKDVASAVLLPFCPYLPCHGRYAISCQQLQMLRMGACELALIP